MKENNLEIFTAYACAGQELNETGINQYSENNYNAEQEKKSYNSGQEKKPSAIRKICSKTLVEIMASETQLMLPGIEEQEEKIKNPKSRKSLAFKIGVGILSTTLAIPLIAGISFTGIYLKSNGIIRKGELIEKIPYEQRTLEQEAFREIYGNGVLEIDFWDEGLKNHPELNRKMTIEEAEKKGIKNILEGEYNYRNAKHFNQKELMEEYKHYMSSQDLSGKNFK